MSELSFIEVEKKTVVRDGQKKRRFEYKHDERLKAADTLFLWYSYSPYIVKAADTLFLWYSYSPYIVNAADTLFLW